MNAGTKIARNLEELKILADGTYQIIYADPPWLYYGSPDKPQAAGKHYQCMSLDDLKSLPVNELAEPKKSVLVMWTTSSKIGDAIELIDAWGFHYRGIFQVWVKTNKQGKPINGQGVRPSFVKPTVEYLLISSRTKTGRPIPILTESLPNVVLAPRPNNQHSKKPDEFRDNIIKLFGQDVKKIELFARHVYPGWDAFGNQL